MRLGKAAEVRTHDERCFGLPDKDIRSGVHGFDWASANHPLQSSADPFDKPLHDLQVVKDRHQRREEYDDGQHINRKDDALGHIRKRSEDHGNTGPRIIDNRLHTATDFFDRQFSPVEIQHECCNYDLQCERCADDAPTDRLAIYGKQIRSAEDYGDACNSDQVA